MYPNTIESFTIATFIFRSAVHTLWAVAISAYVDVWICGCLCDFVRTSIFSIENANFHFGSQHKVCRVILKNWFFRLFSCCNWVHSMLHSCYVVGQRENRFNMFSFLFSPVIIHHSIHFESYSLLFLLLSAFSDILNQ